MTETEEKNEAYRQRNHLVAALARLFPSGITRTDIPDWDPEWHGCCFIDLPTGQISYHYHDSQAFLFEDLPLYEKPWDGHNKETVHRRLYEILGEYVMASKTSDSRYWHVWGGLHSKGGLPQEC